MRRLSRTNFFSRGTTVQGDGWGCDALAAHYLYADIAKHVSLIKRFPLNL